MCSRKQTSVGQKATISAAKTDISSYIAAEKTAEANVEHAKADLEQKQLDWDRAQSLYKAGIMAKQDFDAKKAAYDTDVASVSQAVAQLNQAKAQTASARGHLDQQVAQLRFNRRRLSKPLRSPRLMASLRIFRCAREKRSSSAFRTPKAPR